MKIKNIIILIFYLLKNINKYSINNIFFKNKYRLNKDVFIQQKEYLTIYNLREISLKFDKKYKIILLNHSLYVVICIEI